MRQMDHGVLTTEAYFENASHDEIAPKYRVFLSRPKWVRDRIVLPEESPDKYRDLKPVTPMPPDRAPAAPYGVITRHRTLRRASVSHRPLARPASASGPTRSR